MAIPFNLMMLLVVVGMIVPLTLLAYMLIAPQMRARALVKRRLSLAVAGVAQEGASTASAGRGGGRRRQIQSKLKELEEGAKKKEKKKFDLRKELAQAGMSIEPSRFLIFSGIFGLACTVIYLIMGYPKIGAIPVLIVCGLGLPRMFIKSRAKKRRKKFIEGFADAVDVITRGIRSGLPIGECLNIIGRESPEPIAGEFRSIVEGIKLGLSLEESIGRSLERTPVAELKFFSIVLSIQQQTGGNLAETLTNLSDILRARKRMADKVQALSQEAKSSASIIGSLPFLLVGVLSLVSPEYIAPLFSEDVGKIMIAGGLTWMAIGVIVMKQMISFEI
jgi:tight adherence protein B